MNSDQGQYATELQGKSPLDIAMTLADGIGEVIWDRRNLEDHAREGDPYSEVERLELELWETNRAADPLVTDPFEEFKTPEAEYVRISRETEEGVRLRGQLPHADIGIRPLLAIAAKKCATDEEATEAVRRFYSTLTETAGK